MGVHIDEVFSQAGGSRLVIIDGGEELLVGRSEEFDAHLGPQSASSLRENLLSRNGFETAGIQLSDAPSDFLVPSRLDPRVLV